MLNNLINIHISRHNTKLLHLKMQHLVEKIYLSRKKITSDTSDDGHFVINYLSENRLL